MFLSQCKWVYILLLSGFSFLICGVTVSGAAPIIVDHECADINKIPNSAVEQAKTNLHIAYGHTSHGSQLISGMGSSGTQLNTFLTGSSKYNVPDGLYVWHDGPQSGCLDLDDYAMGGDVGYYPQWVDNTRSYLGDPNSATGRGTGSHADVNVVIWSWCGQVSSRTEADMITTYLTPMSQLELDYPGITFVYMTGHLDGSGASGNLHLRNQQIRDYCSSNNNKVLYDFADIESYDPEGLTNYMELIAKDDCSYDSDGNGSRDANWALAWQSIHTKDVDWWESGAAHSQDLNGNLKGYAAWWLWARLAGWDGLEYTYIHVDPNASGSCGGCSPCYNSIQAGIDDNLTVNCYVRIRGTTLNGDVECTGTSIVRLEGGWNDGFTSRSGSSVINGCLTVAAGCLVAEAIILQ